MPADDSSLRPILILLADGFADWETPLISGAGGDFYGVSVRHASPDGADVTSIGGLRVTGLAPFQPTGRDIVVICGGTGWESEHGPQLIERIGATLRAAKSDGAVIAGICAGVLVLAKSGLLDGVGHTSNGRDWLNHFAADYPGADQHVDQPQALRDRDIITAAGTSPASFAAEVLGAAGVPADQLTEFRAMLSAEHTAAPAAR